MSDPEVIDVEPSHLPAESQSRAIVDAATFAAVLGEEAEKRKLLETYIRTELHEEVDWGKIGPRGKPTLLKPGAEKVANRLRLRPMFERDAETLEMLGDESPGTLAYVCRLYAVNGEVMAEGRGACSPDERPVINTRIKIALKRAMVDAVLRAAALSDQFTQDLEDMPTHAPTPPPERHFAGEDLTGTRGKPPQRKKAAGKKAARKQAKAPEPSRATQPADDDKITTAAAQAFYIACDESAANLGDESVTKDDIAYDVLSQFGIEEHEGKLHASDLLLGDYAEARRLVREWDGPIQKGREA